MKKFLTAICLSVLSIAISAQTKTVTNADLEKYRQERLKAEEDYRKNYAQMGFPSPEELERINERNRRELDATVNQIRREKAQSQNGIIARANALRSQIVSVEAQINYLRSQNGNYSSNQTTSFSTFGYSTYGYRNRRPIYRQRQPQLPQNLQTVQNYAQMYPNSQDVYNRSIGRYAFQNQRNRGGYRGGYIAPVVIYGGNYNNNQTDSQIVYLEQVRAGLYAQWNLLREEARRAGLRID